MAGNTPEYNSAYYEQNKQDRISDQKERAHARQLLVRKAKDKPCADCGIKYPYWIMQFDHVRGEKLFNIRHKVWKLGIAKISEEIEKCEIVCANCHADRTHRRQNSKALSSTG